MDIVPSITCVHDVRRREEILAAAPKDLPIYITDNRHPKYKIICDDWLINNPNGYANWYEERMKLGTASMFSGSLMEKQAKIDELPVYKRRSVLQRGIQILKCHRDHWCQSNPEAKPISIILTTLAALAYDGEQDIDLALRKVLDGMEGHINANTPRIPNSVNPNEDFADRWETSEGKRLELEENFYGWLSAAKRAAYQLVRVTAPREMAEMYSAHFGIDIPASQLVSVEQETHSSRVAPNIVTVGGSHPPKPWCW